jgi:hypothetical protein
MRSKRGQKGTKMRERDIIQINTFLIFKYTFGPIKIILFFTWKIPGINWKPDTD